MRIGPCFLRRGARALTLAAAAALLGAGSAAADTYVLDKDHTEVRFTWNHLGMSRQGGQFHNVSGTVTFDPADPEASVVTVTIPLSGLSTGVAALDSVLLKSKEFFDAETYPTISFRSTEVKPTGGKTALVTGDLTINGTTRPVVLDVKLNFIGDHPMASINPTYAGKYSCGFSATTQIFRSDWGITRTIPYVSDEIQISIETEMHRVSEGQSVR